MSIIDHYFRKAILYLCIYWHIATLIIFVMQTCTYCWNENVAQNLPLLVINSWQIALSSLTEVSLVSQICYSATFAAYNHERRSTNYITTHSTTTSLLQNRKYVDFTVGYNYVPIHTLYNVNSAFILCIDMFLYPYYHIILGCLITAYCV